MALIPGEEVLTAFREHFGGAAQPEVYRAPGRVNLIGEHTDYNLGFVFPIALQMACFVAIARRDKEQLRIYSRDFDEEFSVPVERIREARPSGEWRDYVLGVTQQVVRTGVALEGADVCIASEVPVGSGLSSSAAIEISMALALLGNHRIEPLELALIGHRAEREFVGIPSGIMDQYAAVFGREGAAIQIDCRNLQHEYVPLPRDGRILAVNSLVKHELASSAYRERVAECQAAVAAIQQLDKSVESLRDVSMKYFATIQENIPPVPRQRARHVISDSERVLQLAAASRAGDLREMGRLFVASHRSMQYDYEVSCDEIDFLVDTAIEIPGVYGARMTGGGFGGCTVNLLDPEAEDAFRERLSSAYEARFAKTPVFYDCEPAAGASRVELTSTAP